ncbi:TadE/TadG family type IV pilus assembly protein [Rhodopirellula halodulae]|uniref:TadE/TadG family type IV pilus assembly protein n=1 Tax=Rhodopirellula halodulae TaxID=2894198 RepID=UPI001E511C0D|nr:TadE/TadG family type IV pilus assembly protein [Rhodopirellula sp. JC737]MCC9657468.1 pilus assembly protein [Rhodopirellula sp. JC737]
MSYLRPHIVRYFPNIAPSMQSTTFGLKRSRRNDARRGVVAVEFAIVVPLLFLFFYAGFEFMRVSMIRHTIDNAVYEGARVGIIPGGTNAEIQAEADRIMGTVGVNDYALEVRPANITDDTEEVTVRVSVPLDRNTYLPANYFLGRTIERELTMRREGR